MSTTSPGPKSPTDSSTVRHTKDDALDEREFEQLLAACYTMDDYWKLQCRFVILLAGRLGLRAGEIAHMEASWVDWRRNMIEIPRHETCTNGRDDALCGYCRQKAAQKAAHREGDVAPEDLYHTMWSPKTEAAAREIPFDADTRSMLAIEDYFERFDAYTHSRQSVNRRVKKAARAAPELDADAIYPHALRASAANRFAAKDLDVFSLKAVMGWSELSTAKCYISDSGERTARAIRDSMV